MKKIIVAVDFDGTIVEHKFSEIGKVVPNAIESLKELLDKDIKLILFTMRSDDRETEHGTLEDAVSFCREKGIKFWGVNRNPDQHLWTKSPKIYANYYIDDAAIGCPLIYPKEGKRPYVDWNKTMIMLRKLL